MLPPTCVITDRLRYIKRETTYWIDVACYYLRLANRPMPHIVKRRAIQRYANELGIRCFIETGTYFGDMLMALAQSFDELHSIELSALYYQRARRQLSHKPNIFLYHGDSSTLLPQILERCTHRAIFWLDAHYSGGDTACGAHTTPIMQELNYILRHPIPDHVILIDDARCFTGTSGYPSLVEIKTLLLSLRQNYTLRVTQDIIHLLPAPSWARRHNAWKLASRDL